MSNERVAWQSFSWGAGAESYRFDIEDKGLIGRLTVSDGRAFALPVVVWEAMLEVVKVNRSARAKAEANVPARAGSAWSESETEALRRRFGSGRSVAELSREHGRSVFAVEDQLAKLGLWDRIERRPR